MPCLLNVADILELVVDGFHKRPSPEQYPVVLVHKRVLHVLLYFRDKVYVVNKNGFKKFLAYISPVSEYLSKQPLGDVLVFQRFTVVGVSRRKDQLYYLATVLDYDVQLEAVEQSHRALALGRPSTHRPVSVSPLYVT